MALYYYPQIEVCSIDADGVRAPERSETIEFFNITQNVSITSIVADSEGMIDAGSLNSASEPVALDDVVELRHATAPGTARLILKASAEDAANAAENNVATLVLNDDSDAQDPDAVLAYAVDLGNPNVEATFLGTIGPTGQTSIPFVGVEGKTYRIYVAKQHKDFDFHAANKELLSYQDVFVTSGASGDTPPTFSTASYNSVNSEVDMTFAKNGTATGNIEVEYKPASDSVWTTHATTFLHSATSGSIVITEQPTAVTYDLRLKQVGVTGYSATRQVTVDASSGGGTPPSNLSLTFNDDPCTDPQVTLTWTAGSGSGNYTIERKQGSGGSWSELTNTEAASPYTDITLAASTTVSRTFYYRLKQNDVTGYSNTESVYIPRCTE